METLVIGSDHRGIALKDSLIDAFKQKVTFIDVSPASKGVEDDYPVIALNATSIILNNKAQKGVLICGSGTGMVIAANRFRKIRCAYAHTVEQVVASIREDDINMLAISADASSRDDVVAMLEVFMSETFDGLERHQRRIDMLDSF